MLKSDIFILFPAHYTKTFNLPEMNQHNSSVFIKTMNDVTTYELVNRFCKNILRYKVSDLTIQIRDDDLVNPQTLGTVQAECLLSVIESIKLVTVCLRINAYEENATILLDQISREDLHVTVDDKSMKFSDYLEMYYNITKNGEAKITITQNTKASHQNRMYYLAAESNCSQAISSQITSRKLARYAKQNLAVYNFSEIYVSNNVIYQVYQDYDKDENEKLYHESLLVFILELLVFQLSAINRTNLQVETVLKTQKQVSIKKVKILLSEFAQTMALWEIKLFRYPNTQNIYETIRSRFDLKTIRNNFQHNHQHLNDLVHVRNVHNSLKESKILFGIAIILFLKEVYSLTTQIFDRGITDVIFNPVSIYSSLSILILVLVIFFASKLIKRAN